MPNYLNNQFKILISYRDYHTHFNIQDIKTYERDYLDEVVFVDIIIYEKSPTEIDMEWECEDTGEGGIEVYINIHSDIFTFIHTHIYEDSSESESELGESDDEDDEGYESD
jgi:hypothetical protein|tara:strand:+ start:2700 stop:3032 length:333 start_codon:yes stop_codon:yes gene_type:complete